MLELFASDSVHVPDTVLLEAEWVLREFFHFRPPDVCKALHYACALPNVWLRDPELVERVLDWHEAGMDFADAMHLAASEELPFRTFDRDLVKAARKLTSRSVAAP